MASSMKITINVLSRKAIFRFFFGFDATFTVKNKGRIRISDIYCMSPLALVIFTNIFPKLQTFKTSKHFWIYKSQFLFYSYTLAYVSAWFALKNKLEREIKIKFVI